jgi:5-methylthioadenosine/S-adenosylhomocysteine deaminase
MSMLLINAEVITINSSGSVYKDCCIGISGSTIDYVGKLVPDLKDKYDRVMDLKGGAVMPGFVNAHNHGAMVLFRNYADDLKLMEWLFDKIFPLEDKLDGDIVYWGTCLAILEMIKSGTTTYNDMYFFMEDAARAAGESGIRAVLSRGPPGGYSRRYGPQDERSPGASRKIQQQL